MVASGDGLDMLLATGENKDQLRRLEDQLASRVGIVPFVGAGLSVAYGYPGWKAFLAEQAERAGIVDEIGRRLDMGQYEEAAEDLLTARGQGAFHNAIEATFGPHVITGRTLGGAIMQLPSLASGPVVTTNFDPLLETAFSQAHRPFDSVALGASADAVVSAIRSDTRILLKVHGDAAERSGRILTRQDYERHYGAEGISGSPVDLQLALPRLLGLLLMSRVVLFVGCSLEQDRTVVVLQQIAAAYPEVAQFAIVPAPTSNDVLSRRARFLSDLGIRPIWYPQGRHDLIELLLAHLAQGGGNATLEHGHGSAGGVRSGNANDAPAVAMPVGLPRAVSLVGRDAELAELGERLRDRTGQPVVALHGLGGIGKTALAAELLAHHSADPAFPGGGVWIPCDGLQGQEGLSEVWSRIARSLGLEMIAEIAQPDARRLALGQALAERPRTLLAFDDVEPGIDVGQLLDITSISGRTAIVLTSRDVVAPHRTIGRTLAPLDADAGAALFVSRLRQRAPLRPSEAEKDAIPRLVAAVDGLPLALELLAAYAGVQGRSLDVLVQQVEKEGVTAAALRSEPERVLAVTFDRSWRALPRRQQRLLATLGLIWSSSFPRDYALAIARASVDEGAEADPEADIGALIGYSLVDPIEGDRLRIHPMLRSYGCEQFRKLAPEERKRMGEPLITYWLKVLEKNSDFEHVDVVDSEAELLFGLLYFAHMARENHAVLELVAAMRDWWDLRSRVSEAALGRTWALEAAVAQGDPTVECWARHELAVIQRQLGAWDDARENLERGLALCGADSRPEVMCNLMRELAVLDETMGRMNEARHGYERARELAYQLGVQHLVDRAEFDLAVLNSKTDRLDAAREGFAKALPSIESRGDLNALREGLHNLALVDRKQGRRQEARDGFARALLLAEKLKQPRAVRDEIYHLALLESDQGHLAAARAGFEQALIITRQLLDRPFAAYILLALGDLDVAEGNFNAGRARHEEARQLGHSLGEPFVERAALHALGIGDMRNGKPDDALANFKEALQVSRTVMSASSEALELRWQGLATARLGDLESGRRLVQASIVIDTELKNISALGEDHRALAEIEHIAGNRDGALEALQIAAGYYERAEATQAQLNEVRSLINEW